MTVPPEFADVLDAFPHAFHAITERAERKARRDMAMWALRIRSACFCGEAKGHDGWLTCIDQHLS